MKTSQEILDEFGQIIVNTIVDRNYKGIERIVFKGSPNPRKAKSHDAFSNLCDDEKAIVKNFIIKNSHNLIFEFLKVFEDHPQFKLIYEENEKQINLVEVSEMLKAEPIIENGWIARLSKYVKDDEII